jgi:hypothetical protein
MTRRQTLLIGAGLTLVVTELYHGPFGAADELEGRIESQARRVLDVNEMTQVQAQLADRPLRRTLVLSGPADDFQRSELIRVLSTLPGVGGVKWDPASLPVESTVTPREPR